MHCDVVWIGPSIHALIMRIELWRLPETQDVVLQEVDTMMIVITILMGMAIRIKESIRSIRSTIEAPLVMTSTAIVSLPRLTLEVTPEARDALK